MRTLRLARVWPPGLPITARHMAGRSHVGALGFGRGNDAANEVASGVRTGALGGVVTDLHRVADKSLAYNFVVNCCSVKT
jgi:hypothetical protein